MAPTPMTPVITATGLQYVDSPGKREENWRSLLDWQQGLTFPVPKLKSGAEVPRCRRTEKFLNDTSSMQEMLERSLETLRKKHVMGPLPFSAIGMPGGETQRNVSLYEYMNTAVSPRGAACGFIHCWEPTGRLWELWLDRWLNSAGRALPSTVRHGYRSPLYATRPLGK